jgi:hypothetical protein
MPGGNTHDGKRKSYMPGGNMHDGKRKSYMPGGNMHDGKRSVPHERTQHDRPLRPVFVARYHPSQSKAGRGKNAIAQTHTYPKVR